jgi:DNA-binding NarL/FixJ family response regulator
MRRRPRRRYPLAVRALPLERIVTNLRKDWIALLETSYDLERPTQAWLEALVECAVPLVDRPGAPISLFTFKVTPTTHQVLDVAVNGPPVIAEATRATNAAASQAELDVLYRGGFVGGTLSEVIFANFPGTREKFLEITGGQVCDVFGWCGHTGRDMGIMLNASLLAEETTAPAESRRWSRIVAHMAAGLRLRQNLEQWSLDHERVEAIFDGGGKLQDARDKARSDTARTRLQGAVRAMDRARTASGRADADTSLGEWEALVSGRWSLVDRFDSDGRRFVVAVRNDPAHTDPRGLTERERQIVEFLGLGHTTKQIAYRLGLSPSSVDNAIAAAQTKLGLPSRVQLGAFFSPAGLRAKLAEVALAGEQLLVGSYPLVRAEAMEVLSEAERHVAALIVGGSTNAHIARIRESSERTVANQVQSIFSKLGVRSRLELAARLQSAAEEGGASGPSASPAIDGPPRSI